MKKQLKNTLAALLSVLLVLSCLVPAFAVVPKYGEDGGYLAIGDSIGRGCGAEGSYLDKDGNPTGDDEPGGQYDIFEMRNVQGCVPYQIAQWVGCKAPVDITDQDATYWPLTYPGMTTAVTLDLLGVDDGFSDTKLDYPYYDDMLQYFGYEGSLAGVRPGESYKEGDGQCGNVIELIQKADLITVELGLCDVFYRTYRIIGNGAMLADGISLDLSNTDGIKDLVETAITELKFGYDYWEAHYPILIEKIQELNPDATIVMVGAFNLLNQLPLSDDTIFPLGSVISGITDSMNRKYLQWQKKYNVLYADITNTETLATESDWSLLGGFMDRSFAGSHPSQTGYDYIARQILSVLPEQEKIKNISVDLGRFDSVDYVLLNGIPVKNYTMDGYRLNIPCSCKLPANLTVGIKNDDGTLSVQTYSLTYRIGEGYTAYRLYGNNDIEGTAKKPFQTFIKVFQMLFERISDFFKGLFK